MRNPLLDTRQVCRLPDFQAIEPGHVMPALDDLLETYRQGVEKWLASAQQADWAMVEAELVWADELNRAWSPVSHLNSVADNEDLRAAFNAGLVRLTEHGNWRQQHQEYLKPTGH